jgi:hypothetical protein
MLAVLWNVNLGGLLVTAQQFVEDGADEIQHMNFIFLNFMFDTVKDTRGRLRFGFEDIID